MKPNPQSPLRVKPLKRYRPPRYPLAHEFDSDALAAKPYPFSTRFLTWVTSVGASSVVCSLLGGCDAADATDGPPDNPFTVAKSGLPYRSSPYGTGLPSYLSQEQARLAIEKVFKEAGFKLQPDVDYRKGDLSFKASGFDKDAGVGYVWADSNSLDPADAIIGLGPPRITKDHLEYLQALAEDHQDRYAPALERLLDWLKQHDEANKLGDKLAGVTAAADPKESLEMLSTIMEETLPAEDPDKISLREMEILEIEKPDFVAIISEYDQRFSYASWGGEIRDEREQARAIENPAKRQAALDKIYQELKKERQKAEAATIKKLEDSVRDYLSWARSQGLQQ